MRTNRLIKVLSWIFLLYTLHFTHYTSEALCADKGNPPVAHWRFDEGGGPTAYDETANNNDGTLNAGAGGTNTAVGQMWTRQGKIGGALELDGTDDYVSTTTTGFSTINSYTVEMWVQPTSSKSSVHLWEGSNLSRPSIEGSSTSLTYWVGNTNYINTGTLIVGQWYHIVASYDTSTTTQSLYVNGILKGTSNINVADTFGSVFYIGSRGASRYFPGLIDDVKIYNYARTADQILVDYNAGSAAHLGAGTDPNEGNPPIAYYAFDENSGTTAYDRSGNGKNATITNATWASGKNGNCLSFNGTNAYVTASLGTLNAPFTVEAWGYFNNVSQPSSDYDYVLMIGADGASNPTMMSISRTASNDAAGVDKYYSYTFSGIKAGPVLPGQQWVHIVSVWNTSAPYHSLYINGVLQSVTDAASAVQTNGNLILGSYASSAHWLNGKIDDVRIYNYARTQAQVAYDYSHSAPIAQYKFDEGGGAIAHNEYSSADTGLAPVGWWRMDTASSGSANGASITDSSGNANNGTASYGANLTGMNWATGKIGPGALDFDGTDDRVDLGSKSIVDGLAGVTVTAWINVPVLNAGHHRVFSEEGLLYVGHYGNQISFYMDAVGGSWSHSSTAMGTLTAGQWQFVAWVKDGTTGRVYVDGVQVATMSAPATLGTTSNANYLGTYTGLSQYWDGKMDDVRIYNYARTPEQIYNDYKTTHGTLVGDTKFVDGKIGKALQFDGTEDYVDVPDGSATRPVDLTLECWVKHTNNSATQVYVAKQVGAGSGNSYAIYYTSGLLRGTVGDSSGNGTEITYSWTPTTGQWYHLVYTFDDSSDTQKLYIDGKQVNSNSVTKSIGYNDSPVTISYDFNLPNKGSPGYSVYGQMDDVRIYNYARTADQIMQDYNAGATTRLGAQSAGVADPWGGALPVGHWKLDENTGVLAQDASGNGNNGTLTNGPTWMQGKVGPCLGFDGTNDYVNMGSPTNLGLSGDMAFTIEAWINPSSTRLDGAYVSYGNAGANQVVSLVAASSNKIYSVHYSNDHQFNTTFALNQWQHVIITYDPTTSTEKLYVNGIYTGESWSPVNLNIQTGHALNIGRATWNSTIVGACKIDDVRIYNYARTPAQIAWDYNQGKPVGQWRFNEATSGSAVGTNNIKDDSGNGYHGSGAGTNIAWTTGKFGGALSFNGTNDWVNCGQVLAVDKTRPFTLSAWAKPSAGGMGAWRTIVGTDTSYAQIALNSGNNIVFGQNAGGGWWQSGSAITADTWYHIVGVYDGTNASLYVNGSLVSGPTARTFAANHGVTVMGRYSLAGGEWMNGAIDDARIYNYGRTAEQIQQDYLNGAAARLGD